MAELETAIGGANIIASTEIDTLSELNAVIGDGDLVPQSFTLTIAGTSERDHELRRCAGLEHQPDVDALACLPRSTLAERLAFEIPNGTAPTVDAFGEIAGDSNLWASGRGAPIFYDGTAAVALIGALVSDTPLNGQVPRFNTSTAPSPGKPSPQPRAGLMGNFNTMTVARWEVRPALPTTTGRESRRSPSSPPRNSTRRPSGSSTTSIRVTR